VQNKETPSVSRRAFQASEGVVVEMVVAACWRDDVAVVVLLLLCHPLVSNMKDVMRKKTYLWPRDVRCWHLLAFFVCSTIDGIGWTFALMPMTGTLTGAIANAEINVEVGGHHGQSNRWRWLSDYKMWNDWTHLQEEDHWSPMWNFETEAETPRSWAVCSMTTSQYVKMKWAEAEHSHWRGGNLCACSRITSRNGLHESGGPPVVLVMSVDVEFVGPGPCIEPRDGFLGLKTFL
jgi:hypothetical protein